MRVRGCHPFQTINPNTPDSDVIIRQDWVLDDGVFDNDRVIFVVMRQSTVTLGFLLNCRSGRVSR